MTIFPIIPVWLMLILCGILIFVILKNKKKNWLQIVIVVLLFLINLRIMIPSNHSKILANNLDVLFVIDNTISMVAEDYNGSNTRLSGVKKDCESIINRLLGARFSVISFNNTARIVIPYTKDANMTMESIEIMEPLSETYAKGSSLNTPLETIITSLKSSQSKEDRIRIIFFISDGEITDDSSLNSYKEVKKYLSNGAVLGYGTSSGGKMKQSYYDGEDYIIDWSNNMQAAISKIDETNLKKIASDMDVDYINMSSSKNINSKLDEIENLVNSNLESSDKSSYDDTYFFLVIPLFILLLIEFNKYRRIAL